MQFSIIAALSLVTSAAAVPAPVGVKVNALKLKEAIASNYTWTVSDWTTADGCATGVACTYSESLVPCVVSSMAPSFELLGQRTVLIPPEKGFSVSAPAWKTTIPAFSASCSGSELDDSYTTCDGTASGQIVKTKLKASTTDNAAANLTLSYRFDDPNQA